MGHGEADSSMPEPIWEIVVRRCDNRLVVRTDADLIVYNQYHDRDPELNQRIPLNEHLKAHPHMNVLVFEGFNGPSSSPAMHNPWRFEIELLMNGETQRTLGASGGSQRIAQETLVWYDRVVIQLPPV